jgi:hypothetical protein
LCAADGFGANSASFNPEPLDEMSAWIAKVRGFWAAQLDALDALLKAEDAAAAHQAGKKEKPQ